METEFNTLEIYLKDGTVFSSEHIEKTDPPLNSIGNVTDYLLGNEILNITKGNESKSFNYLVPRDSISYIKYEI